MSADITAASWQTINHLNSLILERTGFMLTESTRMTILAVYSYILLRAVTYYLEIKVPSNKILDISFTQSWIHIA